MSIPLTPAQRFVLWMVVVTPLFVTAAFLLSGALSLVVAATLCAVLWLLRPLLTPPESGASKLRMRMVVGIFGLAASKGFWSNLVDSAVKEFAATPQVRAVLPSLESHLDPGPSYIVLVFVLAGLWIVSRSLKDRTIAGSHRTGPEKTDRGSATGPAWRSRDPCFPCPGRPRRRKERRPPQTSPRHARRGGQDRARADLHKPAGVALERVPSPRIQKHRTI